MQDPQKIRVHKKVNSKLTVADHDIGKSFRDGKLVESEFQGNSVRGHPLIMSEFRRRGVRKFVL